MDEGWLKVAMVILFLTIAVIISIVGYQRMEKAEEQKWQEVQTPVVEQEADAPTTLPGSPPITE